MPFPKIRRTLCRYRESNLPKNAKNVAEVLAAYDRADMSKYRLTSSNQEFYKVAYECNEFEYVIFASDNVITQIKQRIPVEMRNFAMDATFQICPYGVFKLEMAKF